MYNLLPPIKHYPARRPFPRRTAVTVLEVLFATMVVVVGLIGIASIIPVAARNAQEAASHTSALNLGLSWADSFFARGLHRPSPNLAQGQMSWLWYRDFAVLQGTSPGWENLARSGYINNADRIRLNGFFSASPYESSTYSTISIPPPPDPNRRVWGRVPVCIDPYTFTSDSLTQRIAQSAPRVGSYRAAVFPYFNERYDPVLDPFSVPTLGLDQPRMLRVTLAFGQTIPPAGGPYPRGSESSRAMISSIFGSVDELQVDDSVELDPAVVDRDSRPASRFFVRAGGNQALKSLTDGRYTWMATVVPSEPLLVEVNTVAKANAYIQRPAEDCLVSFVVMNRHSHEFVSPLANPVVGDTESQPTGERLVRVYPLSGNFQGGTGGRVRLIASDSVPSKLAVGDWLMLGRNYMLDATGRAYAYFRWYRVIGTSGDAEYGMLDQLRVAVDPGFPVANDPPATTGVWARDVVLEGPDFAFGPTPTMATLVSGVVTVVERQVKLQ